jgi:hypothetical protein
MKMKAGLVGMAAAFLLGMTCSANAALVIVGGSDFVLGSKGTFNPSPDLSSLFSYSATVKRGGTLTVTDGPSDLLFEFLGRESAANNSAVRLDAGNTVIAGIGGPASGTLANQSGVAAFKFTTTFAGGRELANGETKDGIQMAFLAIGAAIYAFLDDGGDDGQPGNVTNWCKYKRTTYGKVEYRTGTSGDCDFDDGIYRITVAEVPLPATGLLILGALGVLGSMARRRDFAG